MHIIFYLKFFLEHVLFFIHFFFFLHFRCFYNNTSISTSLFLMFAHCSISCIDQSIFNLSSLMDIYIVSCVFAITNNVAVSILVAISLPPCANISVGQTPKMELHFKFDRHCQIVLQNCVSIHTSIRCVRVPISLLYLQPWILCLLNFCKHKAESGVALFHFAFP